MSRHHRKPPEPSPMERVEALYEELIAHYGGGDQPEMRAAAKLLLVALARFREHGGPDWASLLDEYVGIVQNEPDRFQRLLDSNRSQSAGELFA